MSAEIWRRTWTPVFTFATPGNLSVTYGTQIGLYTRDGRQITLHYNIVTSAFTHTTAAGNLQITGLPIASHPGTGRASVGKVAWRGITKANYTEIASHLTAGSSTLEFIASGSGVATANIAAGDMPTGGTVELIGTHIYFL